MPHPRSRSPQLPRRSVPQAEPSLRWNTVALAIAMAAVAIGCRRIGLAEASRRSRNELDAAAARQRTLLAAERERLHDALHAERERSRDRVERKLLDRGAVLLTELTQAVAEMNLDTRGRPPVTDARRELGRELAVFQGQLSLWFDERSEVVAAFEDAIALTEWLASWIGELRDAARHLDEESGRTRPPSPEQALADLIATRKRYISAAHAHLHH